MSFVLAKKNTQNRVKCDYLTEKYGLFFAFSDQLSLIGNNFC